MEKGQEYKDKPGASGAPGSEKLTNGSGNPTINGSGESGQRKKSSSSKGPSLHDKIVNVFFAMTNPALNPQLPPFHVELGVLEDAAMNRSPILIGKGKVCAHLGPRAVASYILQYSQSIAHEARLNLRPAHAKEIAEYWLANCPVTTDIHIKPVAEASEKTLCWHRLPWDLPKKPAKTPTFDEMFSRMDHPELVMAWVGSLLDPHADREQYLWIHGEGLDGKSRFANFLHRVMGPAARAESVPTTQERRFWTSGLRGKRLIVFGDCDNGRFAADGFFKRLTGDDPVRIEEKGVNATDARLVAKFLFHGNVRPKIGTSRADLRRALIVEMRPVEGHVCATQAYDTKLWDEGASFLARCIAEYKKVCPDGGKIPLSEDARHRVVELAEMNEEIWAQAMSKIVIENVPRSSKDLPLGVRIRDLPYMTPAELGSILADLRWNDARIGDFKEYLRRKYGVTSKVVQLERGRTERRYVGITQFREGEAPKEQF